MARKLAELTPDDIRLCSVVKSELYYGTYKSTRRDRNLANLNRFFSQFISLPFDDNAAAIAGQVRTQLDVVGTPIGSNDLLIAAIALSNDLTLVTHNTREFEDKRRSTGTSLLNEKTFHRNYIHICPNYLGGCYRC